MKIKLWQSLFMLSLVSCGSLRIIPNGCHTEGIWGAKPIEAHAGSEIQVHEGYFIFFDDHEVKLKDLMKEVFLECKEIQKIRVEVESVFFIRRELNIFITKK